MLSVESPLIRAKNLGKAFQSVEKPQTRFWQLLLGKRQDPQNQFWALRNVSFEIYRGETFGIVGKNGAGKSTLLQLLCGTLEPSEGDLEIHGRLAALLELGAGFNPEFTGLENVRLNARILGLTHDEVEERLADIIAFADIGEFINKPVKHYSSGMFLRLAFAVVAHVDADILIIDEALAVGDALFAQKCMRFLREFSQRGALLFVSHDTASVTSLCQRALWLDHGTTRMLGDAKTVTESYLEYLFGVERVVSGEEEPPSTRMDTRDEMPVDMRRELLIGSNLRNDLRVFSFDPQASSFGTGEARVDDVLLRDSKGAKLAWVVGGEHVTLEIRFHVLRAVDQPIVGFLFKDRLGQVLFSDNTYLTFQDRAPHLEAGGGAVARFSFRLPYLQAGDYSFTVAVASGTQESHTHLQWVHDALLIRCEATHAPYGLVSLPMSSITLEAMPAPSMQEDTM